MWHHVVQAGVVPIGPFGQQKVRAFAGVSRNDVADDNSAMAARALHESLVLILGAEIRIDVEADAIEVAVHGRRVSEIADSTRSLHGTRMDSLDTDCLEGVPQSFIGERGEHGVRRAPMRRLKRG